MGQPGRMRHRERTGRLRDDRSGADRLGRASPQQLTQMPARRPLGHDIRKLTLVIGIKDLHQARII
jgi:hypothetical protein